MKSVQTSAADRRPFRLLVYPKFQLVLLGTNLAVNFLIFFIVWMHTRSTLLNLKPAAGLSGFAVEYYKHYLDYQTSSFETTFFWSLGISLVLSSLFTLYISHKFAGPIIRMKNYFQDIADGNQNVGALSFRDGDYLGDLPPIINRAVQALKSQD